MGRLGINWLRVVVGVNAAMTALLFYLLLESHKVVEALGDSLIFMSQVLEFIVRLR